MVTHSLFSRNTLTLCTHSSSEVTQAALAERSGLVEQVGEWKAKAEDLESRLAVMCQQVEQEPSPQPLKKTKTVTTQEESGSDKQVAAYQSFLLFQLTLTLTHQ